MGFDLHVDAGRWHRHTDRVAAETPGLVPVVKGNGYGIGRDALAAEAGRLGLGTIAVGTYAEVPEALEAFAGDVMVLTPWRPFFADVVLDPRVVHTVGRVDDVATLAQQHPGTRVVLEGETSMARHGFDRHDLAAAVAVLGDLVVEGFAIHLPLEGGHLAEADRWAAVLDASQVETTRLFVSHLAPAELTTLREQRPHLEVRPRIGTRLWLGDLAALSVRAQVLDVHHVSRGEHVGYRQRTVPRDGYLVVVAGGTSHGVGLEAPKAGGVVTRGKTLARGGLEAAGLARSPFTVAGRQRWFVEPPHMQASMLYLPATATPPAVGDTVAAAVRYTTATFDTTTFA